MASTGQQTCEEQWVFNNFESGGGLHLRHYSSKR